MLFILGAENVEIVFHLLFPDLRFHAGGNIGIVVKDGSHNVEENFAFCGWPKVIGN